MRQYKHNMTLYLPEGDLQSEKAQKGLFRMCIKYAKKHPIEGLMWYSLILSRIRRNLLTTPGTYEAGYTCRRGFVYSQFIKID